ncbi:MAG: 3-phosphoshikimate 1-carboxyvinyltransferase, partial [Anaerolineales bacterium]|nr:3-phosphoshikimate 1-carboxyvinyltransferase [Anaerolineales bacterium]
HRSAPLHGKCEVPGDKSLSHRTALLASLAEGESRIENYLDSGVTRTMLDALKSLGVRWVLDGDTLTIQGTGPRGLRPAEDVLDCGHSATTMRLLAGALAGANVPCVLDGSPGLRTRPMRRIVDPLREMGAQIEAASGGTAPLILSRRRPGDRLRGLSTSLPVASAQVKSAILLAALGADGETKVEEPGPSRDHTERLLSGMGVQVVCDPAAFQVTLIPPNRPLQPLHFCNPGDISSAAFLICAALVVPGSEITVHNVGLNPTRIGLLNALKAMGAQIEIRLKADEPGERVGDVRVRASDLHGIKVDGELVVRMIDEFPAFAIAAAHAQGQTVVREAEELRHKESDRITALCTGLSALGVKAHELQDGFIISGNGIPGGAVVDPHSDHRLAMALSVAGLAAEKPVTVLEADIITESFPEFIPTLCSLGANVAVKGNSEL